MSLFQFGLQLASESRMREYDCCGWRAIRVGVTLALILLCTACGFQLREDTELPPEMARTRMVIDDEYSLLARRVRVLLEQSGATFVSSKNATAFLEIPTSNVVTEVLTVGDNARVREFRISHTVKFRVTDADGRDIIPSQTIRQAREVSFDEQKILAASREQEYLEQDLAETLARMLVTRLGASERSTP
jgi:LPS-assembly lipoprotein